MEPAESMPPAKRWTVGYLMIGVTMLLALIACGGDDEGTQDSSTSTTTAASTTTTIGMTAEEAYEARLRSSLQTASEDEFAKVSDLGRSLCETFATTDPTKADAPNDSPGSDAARGEALVAMALRSVYDNMENHQVAAEIMRATGENLCPDFARQIEAFLTVQGV